MSPVASKLVPACAPTLTREGITWRTVEPGVVEIRVDVVNDHPDPTGPGELVVEAAALGAFVPFRPVTRIALGSLEPGERRPVSARVRRRTLERSAPTPSIPAEVFGQVLRSRGIENVALFDSLSHLEWAGNINVYFNRAPEHAVERHCATGLLLSPGAGVAVFVELPEANVDTCLEIESRKGFWQGECVGMQSRVKFLVARAPAEQGASGRMALHCTRSSDLKTVDVEFELETRGGV